MQVCVVNRYAACVPTWRPPSPKRAPWAASASTARVPGPRRAFRRPGTVPILRDRRWRHFGWSTRTTRRRTRADRRPTTCPTRAQLSADDERSTSRGLGPPQRGVLLRRPCWLLPRLRLVARHRAMPTSAARGIPRAGVVVQRLPQLQVEPEAPATLPVRQPRHRQVRDWLRAAGSVLAIGDHQTS